MNKLCKKETQKGLLDKLRMNTAVDNQQIEPESRT